MARIPYAEPSDLPADKRHLLDTLDDDASADAERRHSLPAGTLNVYRAIGRTPPLLEAFRTYAGRAWNECGLAPHDREIVILATARATDSAYEWQQHVRVALDAGMDPDQLVAVARSESDQLGPARAALVAYVDAFVDGAVTDATHDRLAAHYDEETIVGVGLLAGCYLGLARVLQALDVDLEAPFVGWGLENR
ncbi:MAG: carboxymuconolactone decarboxylase family protein [Haloarculaceae archaeon]